MVYMLNIFSIVAWRPCRRSGAVFGRSCINNHMLPSSAKSSRPTPSVMISCVAHLSWLII